MAITPTLQLCLRAKGDKLAQPLAVIIPGTEKVIGTTRALLGSTHLTPCLPKALGLHPLIALGSLQPGFRALGFMQLSSLLSLDHVLFESTSLISESLVAGEDRYSKYPEKGWNNKRCSVPFDQNAPPAAVTGVPARPQRGRTTGKPVREEGQSCVQPRQAPATGCARLFSGSS